ncbi:hypothetical protein LLG46_06775 [bacterium]|nr:hypothetical protein [bacterium]
MRRIIFLVLALTLVCSVPLFAARVTSTALTHYFEVEQVCPVLEAGETDDVCRAYLGYLTIADPYAGDPVINAAPGILSIVPGGTDWPNYIAAAQQSPAIPYTIKNTTFTKQTPEIVQCADVFPAHKVTQQGTANIRLWWPLMYECPSTVFTLSILYGTPVAWDDDGTGPNPAAWVHAEQWEWHVDADLDSLRSLLYLFHELPFGKDEVPLISDELLFEALLVKIDAAQEAYDAGDLAEAAAQLAEFELEVMDACIIDSPLLPNPTGLGTGIANSDENPACCKLLCDVEYILQTTGIGNPSKD